MTFGVGVVVGWEEGRCPSGLRARSGRHAFAADVQRQHQRENNGSGLSLEY